MGWSDLPLWAKVLICGGIVLVTVGGIVAGILLAKPKRSSGGGGGGGGGGGRPGAFAQEAPRVCDNETDGVCKQFTKKFPKEDKQKILTIHALRTAVGVGTCDKGGECHENEQLYVCPSDEIKDRYAPALPLCTAQTKDDVQPCILPSKDGKGFSVRVPEYTEHGFALSEYNDVNPETSENGLLQLTSATAKRDLLKPLSSSLRSDKPSTFEQLAGTDNFRAMVLDEIKECTQTGGKVPCLEPLDSNDAIVLAPTNNPIKMDVVASSLLLSSIPECTAEIKGLCRKMAKDGVNQYCRSVPTADTSALKEECIRKDDGKFQTLALQQPQTFNVTFRKEDGEFKISGADRNGNSVSTVQGIVISQGDTLAISYTSLTGKGDLNINSRPKIKEAGHGLTVDDAGVGLFTIRDTTDFSLKLAGGQIQQFVTLVSAIDDERIVKVEIQKRKTDFGDMNSLKTKLRQLGVNETTLNSLQAPPIDSPPIYMLKYQIDGTDVKHPVIMRELQIKTEFNQRFVEYRLKQHDVTVAEGFGHKSVIVQAKNRDEAVKLSTQQTIPPSVQALFQDQKTFRMQGLDKIVQQEHNLADPNSYTINYPPKMLHFLAKDYVDDDAVKDLSVLNVTGLVRNTRVQQLPVKKQLSIFGHDDLERSKAMFDVFEASCKPNQPSLVGVTQGVQDGGYPIKIYPLSCGKNVANTVKNLRNLLHYCTCENQSGAYLPNRVSPCFDVANLQSFSVTQLNGKLADFCESKLVTDILELKDSRSGEIYRYLKPENKADCKSLLEKTKTKTGGLHCTDTTNKGLQCSLNHRNIAQFSRTATIVQRREDNDLQLNISLDKESFELKSTLDDVSFTITPESNLTALFDSWEENVLLPKGTKISHPKTSFEDQPRNYTLDSLITPASVDLNCIAETNCTQVSIG